MVADVKSFSVLILLTSGLTSSWGVVTYVVNDLGSSFAYLHLFADLIDH